MIITLPFFFLLFALESGMQKGKMINWLSVYLTSFRFPKRKANSTILFLLKNFISFYENKNFFSVNVNVDIDHRPVWGNRNFEVFIFPLSSFRGNRGCFKHITLIFIKRTISTFHKVEFPQSGMWKDKLINLLSIYLSAFCFCNLQFVLIKGSIFSFYFPP